MLSVEPAEKLQRFWDGIVAEGGAHVDRKVIEDLATWILALPT
jgi:hypothetical protein